MSVLLGRRAGDASLTSSLVFVSIASGLFLPLSLVFFTEVTTIPLSVVGVIVGVSGLTSVPVPAVAGRLADRYGATRLVMLSQAIQALAFVGYVFAREPLSVFVVTALMSMGGRLFWSTIFVAVADHAGAEGRQQHWFAVTNIARTAGIAAGGLITGIALTVPGTAVYIVLAAVAAGCLGASAVLMLPVRARPSSTRPSTPGSPPSLSRSKGGMLRDARFFGLLITNTVFAMSTLLLGLTIPVVVRNALSGPGWLSSFLLVGNALLVSSLGIAGARYAVRRRPFSVLKVAAVCWAVGCTLLAVAASTTLPVAMALLTATIVAFSFAEILHAPTSVAIVSSMAPMSRRGNYLAMWQYSFMAAEIIGPVLFATLFAVQHAAPFVVVLALNLTTVPALLLVQRPSRSNQRTILDGNQAEADS
ncbi:MFS transporter [Planctomonas sp. JC2975]|uniref:MFS transporter n=1 Tax=Planctomonas sp. JC2975 TaxID=2729626 RepID=UPI00147463AA|nr:MFS transporter [Planctomonas sp. JC2975]NNC10882.1 MFS transporter [Planctomonas sp. JC2975]